MTRPTPNRPRRGFSLTEVLVALFVMAIGMLSLLTLFPLGAMQVGQALRDDRTSQLARQADAYLRQTWRNDLIPNGGNGESYFWAMDDPYLVIKYPVAGGSVMRFVGSDAPTVGTSWYNSTSLLVQPVTVGSAAVAPATSDPTQYTLTGESVRTTPAGLTLGRNELYVVPAKASVGGPGYPVVFDPPGLNAIASYKEQSAWVGYPSAGAATTPRLPRRTCRAVNPFPPTAATLTAFELTSLTDDLTFAPDGQPDPNDLGRQGRYSYAAVIQRPNNTDRFTANLWVLVYDGRSVLPQSGDELVVAPDAPAGATSRSVTVTLPNRVDDTSPVLLRRGGWLIDGTIDASATGRKNFYPYRVSGYTESGNVSPPGTTQYFVDLETPLVEPLTATSQIYFLAGLTEVFTRPKLRPDVNY
jgi:prepilin-type N-terminal cleavage/methylation domain-containing protein